MSQSIHGTIFRDTLLTIPEIKALVAWGDQYKIFWGHVPEQVDMPYIAITYLYGSDDLQSYKSRAEDVVYSIVGVTADPLVASQLEQAIDKIHKLDPVINMDGVCLTNHIWRVSYYYDRSPAQNVTIIQIGGYYRLSLSY